MGRLPFATRVPMLALAFLPLACADPTPPNLVVITVDTLRADYLGPYGDRSAQTPNLDELARQGTVFERAVAPMPLTRPSHFSLLTSKYPREHGVVNNAIDLPEEARSVAEILAREGYDTAAFLSVRLLDESSGASQGFAFYDAPADRSERTAEETTERLRRWLDERSTSRPFFLWIHLFDPHIPYSPPVEFRPAAVTHAPAIDWPRLNAIAGRHEQDVPGAVLEEAKLLYRGEIAYTDHWIGELMTAIDGHAQAEDTLVVFTADHGECFENGSYFEHSDCLFEPSIRIPLIIRFPKQFPMGERRDAPCGIIDIAPTLLRSAGIDIPADFSGEPLQDMGHLADRFLLIQHPLYQGKLIKARPQKRRNIRSVAGQPRREMLVDQEQVGLIGRDWKYLRSGEEELLFRLSPGVDEVTNRVDSESEARRAMLDRLRRELADHPLQVIEPSEINAELLETLTALGYLDN